MTQIKLITVHNQLYSITFMGAGACLSFYWDWGKKTINQEWKDFSMRLYSKFKIQYIRICIGFHCGYTTMTTMMIVGTTSCTYDMFITIVTILITKKHCIFNVNHKLQSKHNQLEEWSKYLVFRSSMLGQEKIISCKYKLVSTAVWCLIHSSFFILSRLYQASLLFS